jgi:hypothetical protein
LPFIQRRVLTLPRKAGELRKPLALALARRREARSS